MKRPMALMVAALLLVFGAIFGVVEGKKILIARYLANYEPPPVTVSAEEAGKKLWGIGDDEDEEAEVEADSTSEEEKESGQ